MDKEGKIEMNLEQYTTLITSQAEVKSEVKALRELVTSFIDESKKRPCTYYCQNAERINNLESRDKQRSWLFKTITGRTVMVIGAIIISFFTAATTSYFDGKKDKEPKPIIQVSPVVTPTQMIPPQHLGK